MNYQKQIINGTAVIVATSTRRDEIMQLKNQLDKQGYVITQDKQANVHALRAIKTK